MRTPVVSILVRCSALAFLGGLLGLWGFVPAAAGDPRLRAPILYDRVLPLSGIERFDGSEGSATADLATWRQLYDELRRASSDPAALPSPDVLRERARATARVGVVPLALVDCLYLRSGPQGEVVPHRAFAAAALRDRTWRGREVRFRLDLSECFTSDRMPRGLEIDCSDGLGWRELELGADCVASYHDTGRKVARIRATFDDDTTLEASFAFEVRALVVPSPNDTLSITATVPYQGQVGTGAAYVYLAPVHPTLENPVIVVEGFDLDNTMGWDELYAQLNQQNLLETLRAEGFDAVVLDFTDATEPIQRNAFVLTALIQEVAARVGPQTTVALVGASMGGLVARYGLAYLETFGSGHPVRTLISFDAPHAGANIPLGVQYWVDFFAGQSADAAFLRDRLNRPAARQMLVYHFTNPPGATGQSDPLRSALISDLAAVGDFPSLPRLVAVANGSGQALGQGFASGDQLIAWSYGSLLLDVRGDVWAVPRTTSHIIFDGRIRIIFSDTRRTVTVSGTAPFDDAPGGSRPTMAEMDSTAAPFGDIVALHDSHCFVPTISALALDTTDLFYDIAGDPNLLAHTPFDAVYFPVDNQEHVTITPESAVWFRSEIEAGVTAVGPDARPGAAAMLAPASPNPFPGSTRLAFALPASAEVELAVFGVDGRLVRELVRGPLAAGPHELDWRGVDAQGRRVPAGVYFVRLRAGRASAVRRVVKID